MQTSRSYCVLSKYKWFVLDCSISKRIDPQFTTEVICEYLLSLIYNTQRSRYLFAI